MLPPPGLYRLKADVKNPLREPGHRYEADKVAWKAGQEWTVLGNEDGSRRLLLRGYSLDPHHAGLPALLAALVPVTSEN
jgi:hypothetical protein